MPPLPLEPFAVNLEGSCLIEASAGTGKTYNITLLLLRLLLEKGLRIQEILVVTFTEAATAELRDRVRQRLREAATVLGGGAIQDEAVQNWLQKRAEQRAFDLDRVTRALRDFDEAPIFTIHGFCKRMLAEHAFESGVLFEAELGADLRPLLEEIVDDYSARQLYHAPAALVRFLLDNGAVNRRALVSLLETVLGRPRAAVLPEAVPTPPIAEFDRLYNAAREMWERDQAAIEGVLDDALPGLKGNVYRRDWLAGWLRQLDELLTGAGKLTFDADSKLQRFRASVLRDNTKPKQAPPAHPFFDLWDEFWPVFAAMEAAVVAFRRELVDYARRELPRRKEERNVQSFDDLLTRLAEALSGPAGEALAAAIRGQYRAVMIDEFQDTDRVQYEIFRGIYHDAPDASFFVIGDPKQSIYKFRGADIHTYLKAKTEERRSSYTINTNYRADPGLIRAVNTLFTDHARPFWFTADKLPFVSVLPRPNAADALRLRGQAVPPLQFRHLKLSDANRKREPQIAAEWERNHFARLVAADIARFLEDMPALVTLDAAGQPVSRDVSPGDIAVLVRKHAQARAVQQELARLRIPTVRYGEENVFAGDEAVELRQLLAAVADPFDMRAVKTALATSFFGLTAHRLMAVSQDDQAWEHYLALFQRWRDRWVQAGFLPMMRAVMEHHEAVEPDAPARTTTERLLLPDDGERRLTNVLHLTELLHDAAVRRHLNVEALRRWLDQQIVGSADAAGDEQQLRLESDAHAVKLTTVHHAKGLQFPIVFCPYAWDGQLLHRADDNALVSYDPDADRELVDLGSADHDATKALAEQEAMAENLRLLYVALTRAKHFCVVGCGPFHNWPTAALAYLLHCRDGEAATPDDVKARLKSVDDAEIEAVIRELIRRSDEGQGPAIGYQVLPDTPGRRYRATASEEAALSCPSIKRHVRQAWSHASYTKLVKAARRALTPDEEFGYVDEGVTPPSETSAAAPSAGSPVPLAEFPAGRVPGLLLHAVFENLDFPNADADAIRLEVARQWHAFPLNAEARDWTEPLAQTIAAVLDTPLPRLTTDAPAVRLRGVTRADRLAEVRFVFPAALDAAPGHAIGAADLSAVFRRHGGSSAMTEYAARLAELNLRDFRGYWGGAIDLAFRQDGRFFVVDYKSNRLGAAYEDYAPPRLAREMAENHYVLQYHLYCVALHRYLAQRVPGYEYDAHFGGVYYLFLRGVRASGEATTGVYAHRPPWGLVRALDALFTGAKRGGA